MKCLFSCRPWEFGWWLETRPSKHGDCSGSHRQGGRPSEKWSACHIANIGSEAGCHHWYSMDNCSEQVVLSEGACAAGLPTSKRNCIWGLHSFRIMKTLLYWNGSSQVMKASWYYEPETKWDSMHYHLSLKSSKSWHLQQRYCSTFTVHYLLYSASTEKPLTLMCTMRHSSCVSQYTSNIMQARTKDQG